ncbi:uncharacterized protein LOC135685182 [Rhopilema esculentum]|uniref:uncharacterized protein LOC135685182 n=1 Tax=Rhopilema esculentum TaxID=499914 RepID=UPI0031DA7F51|eukprot:gene17693-9350_t
MLMFDADQSMGYDFDPRSFMSWGYPVFGNEWIRNDPRRQPRMRRANDFFGQDDDCHCRQCSRERKDLRTDGFKPRLQRDMSSGKSYWEIPIQKGDDEIQASETLQGKAKDDKASLPTKPKAKATKEVLQKTRTRPDNVNTPFDEPSSDQEETDSVDAFVACKDTDIEVKENVKGLKKQVQSDKNHCTLQLEQSSTEPEVISDSKATKLQFIKDIGETVAELSTRIDSFQGAKGSKDYLYLEEMLMKSLLRLDEILTDGDEEVRISRRQMAQDLNAKLMLLERKYNDPANNNCIETESSETSSISICSPDQPEVDSHQMDIDVNQMPEKAEKQSTNSQCQSFPEEQADISEKANCVDIQACVAESEIERT